jgi:hypothetical protein
MQLTTYSGAAKTVATIDPSVFYAAFKLPSTLTKIIEVMGWEEVVS